MIAESSSGITQARRQIAAAGALWREGLVPEAHAAVMQAFDLMLEAWAAVGPTPGQAGEPDAPEEREARALAALTRSGYRHAGGLREALAAGVDAGAGRPPTDPEWIWAEAERLWRFTSRRFTSEAARKRGRVRMRIGVAAIAVLALAFAARAWLRPHVSASGVYAPDFPAELAVDGLDTTEWVLPDRVPGWLQLNFPFARHIRSVRIVNGHNRFWMDRGSQEVRATAYSDKGVVGTAGGRFDALKAERSVLDLAIDARAVTHVRVDVLSYFGGGGALAEVEVH